MTVLEDMKKRSPAERVCSHGYYTDGADLYEVESVDDSGRVMLRNCSTELERCAGYIGEFRAKFWLVAEKQEAA